MLGNFVNCIKKFQRPCALLVQLNLPWIYLRKCQLTRAYNQQSSTIVLRRLVVSQLLAARHYIKKRDLSILTDEEKFVLKVLEYNNMKDINKDTLKVYARRLSHLVKHGCKAYELTEYPQILQLSEEEVTERTQRLTMIGVPRVSVCFLKYAKPTKSDAELRRQIKLYLKQQNGHANSIDVLVEALGCSDDVMLAILTRNTRLVGQRGLRNDVVEKVNFLRDHGARPEDLWRNSNMLKNFRLDVLKTRTKRLVELGYDNPLPIEVIARTETEFNGIVARLVTNFGNRNTTTQTLAESVDSVANWLPALSGRKTLSARLKIEYLLLKGYTPQQIIGCIKILEVPIAALQNAVKELHKYSLASVTLDDCLRYATAGRLTVSRLHVRRMIANELGCTAAHLPTILTKDLSIRIVQLRDIRTNLAFLYDKGFTKKQIMSVPLIFLHSTEVLQRHWSDVADPNSQTEISIAFKRWTDCSEKQLNVLQYAIEQSANFRHAAIVFPDEVDQQNFKTIDINADQKGHMKPRTNRSSDYSDDDVEHDDSEELSSSVNIRTQ